MSVYFKQDVVVLTLYPSTLLHGPYFCLLVVGVLIYFFTLSIVLFNCACNLSKEHGLILLFETVYEHS